MGTKVCTHCKKELDFSEFSERKDRPHLAGTPGGLKSYCNMCLAYWARWRYAHNTSDYREKQKQWSKTKHQNLKAEVIVAYGGKCACCGETEPLFLTIDHINGNGAESRRQGEGSGGNLYARLKREGFPKDNYQLLCFNCNCSKRQFGTCPHETARQLLTVDTNTL